MCLHRLSDAAGAAARDRRRAVRDADLIARPAACGGVRILMDDDPNRCVPR
jgi:hypothetical protein